MKFLELVKYLIDPKELDLLYNDLKVDKDSEALLIYMKDALELKSDIFIFEIEKTEDKLHFISEGTNYYQLFPVDLAVDLIESDLELKDKGYSNEYIAERLLDYRLNDA